MPTGNSRPIESHTKKSDTHCRHREYRCDSDARKHKHTGCDGTLHRSHTTRAREHRPSRCEPTCSRDKRGHKESCKSRTKDEHASRSKPATVTRHNVLEKKSSTRHRDGPSAGTSGITRHQSERGQLAPPSSRLAIREREPTEKKSSTGTKHRDDYVSRRNTERTRSKEPMASSRDYTRELKEPPQRSNTALTRAVAPPATGASTGRKLISTDDRNMNANVPQRSNTMPTPRVTPAVNVPTRSKSAPVSSLKGWFWVPGSAKHREVSLADNPMVPKSRPGWWSRTFGSKSRKRV